jgi:hypothetical protein
MIVTLKHLIPVEIPDWCDIFNHPEFYNLHKTDSSYYFSFFSDEKLIGLCHFTETAPGVFRSPFRGTYGNISFKEDLDLRTKYQCVDELIAFMKSINAKRVEIISAPFAHDLHQCTSFFNIFLNKQFGIINQEINHTLVVDEIPLVEKMMRNNKKRLNKCIREGFVFEEVSTVNDIAEVYQTLKENREGNGHKMSMSLDQIMDMYKVFKEKMYFFKGSQNGVCAVGGLCIKINPKVLYVFYWGDKPGYQQYSPVAFMANGIYEFARKNQFKMMDAGISTLNGEPNFGLITFKENLGFSTSLKLTYAKEL